MFYFGLSQISVSTGKKLLCCSKSISHRFVHKMKIVKHLLNRGSNKMMSHYGGDKFYVGIFCINRHLKVANIKACKDGAHDACD